MVVANATVTGTTSGMTAQLIDVADGSEAAIPDNMTLFKYTNSGTNNTTKAFADNEVLTRTRTDASFIVAKYNYIKLYWFRYKSISVRWYYFS